jgi:hypothetical protein
MRVSLHHRPLELGPDRVAAELTPRDEELLVRREAPDVGQRRLAFSRDGRSPSTATAERNSPT